MDPVAAFADAIAHARSTVALGEAAADDAARLALLRPLFEDVAWLDRLAASALACMAADPLHLFGITAIRNGPLRQILLASGPRLSIVLCTLDGLEAPESDAEDMAAFSGSLSVMRLVSTRPAAARLATLGRRSGRCRERSFLLRPERIVMLDETQQSLKLDPSPSQILFLRARVRRIPAPLVQSIAIGESAPRRLANGDDGVARSLALAAMLRTLGRPAPVASLRALLPRVRGAQRWTLMREMLAANTASAWPDLLAMAEGDEDPAVRAIAGRVCARLDASQNSMAVA